MMHGIKFHESNHAFVFWIASPLHELDVKLTEERKLSLLSFMPLPNLFLIPIRSFNPQSANRQTARPLGFSRAIPGLCLSGLGYWYIWQWGHLGAKKEPEIGWVLDEMGTGDSALLGSMPKSHQGPPCPPCPPVAEACHQQNLRPYYVPEGLGNQPHEAPSHLPMKDWMFLLWSTFWKILSNR